MGQTGTLDDTVLPECLTRYGGRLSDGLALMCFHERSGLSLLTRLKAGVSAECFYEATFYAHSKH